jgi:uncharacterized protein
MITGFDFVLIGIAAIAAGLINALAGGGTLITFPMLTFVGVPAVGANITSTVSLLPGYLGATFAQAGDLRGQKRRLLMLLPAGALGGLIGGYLLVNTGERLFRELVPYLILLASALLAVQEPMRRWVIKRMGQTGQENSSEVWTIFPVTLASVYGGYFGAGLSVIILAVLGLVINDNLTRLNALKQFVGFSTNVTAAIFFLFSGHVVWEAVLVMAIGALLGGALGGRLAGKIKPSTLRALVVVIGVSVSIIYFLR